MESEKEIKKVDFKEFLDKCTNLISLFGVFNALLIYSFSIRDSDLDQFLIPAFLVLSIFVWYELMLFTWKSSDGSRKYHLFWCLISMVQIGLILIFIKKCASLIVFLIYGLIFFGLIYIISMFLHWLFFKLVSVKYLQKMEDKKIEKIVYINIVIALIFTGIILKIISYYISNDSVMLIQKVLRRISSNEYSLFPTK